jgi:hypothetical protein
MVEVTDAELKAELTKRDNLGVIFEGKTTEHPVEGRTRRLPTALRLQAFGASVSA